MRHSEEDMNDNGSAYYADMWSCLRARGATWFYIINVGVVWRVRKS